MTKKKRELIEILLDNVKPEDWPENLPYAAQDKSCSMVYVYANIPDISSIYADRWECGAFSFKGINIQVELCRYWNKTIVHRDEFMKRWNDRNKVVDSEGWIQWNGGEMPVEKGTLIDVKYRRGLVNLHVKAGEYPSGGSISDRCAIDFKHDDNQGDIIAYRLHVPKEQKMPQQLALAKFGTDWHENEGVQPVSNEVLIDLIMCNGDEKKKYLANHWSWHKEQALKIKKWRIHSETDTTTPPAHQESHTEETKPIQQEVKATDTQIDKIIAERGSNYGRFEDGAEIIQQLKLIAHTSRGWERMTPVQREAMDMILHKIGRILNGDPAYVDSWIDIEGYSNLVSSWLKGESK